MKLSKTTLTVLVGVIIIFIVIVLYLYNREISRIEHIAVAEIRAEVEREQAIQRGKEQAELKAKIVEHEDAIVEKTKQYEDAKADAAKQRSAKEAARKVNASLDQSWQQKYSTESKAHGITIIDWGKSDKRIDEQHKKVIDELNAEIGTLKESIFDYQEDQRAGDKIVLDLKGDLALEKRKGKKRLVWGPCAGGGIDKKPFAGIGIMYYIGKIG